jgi:hypothetical protein
MSRRHDNKFAARVAQDLRWELVHAAGCAFRTGRNRCATAMTLDPESVTEFPPDSPRRVSVPRSLRPALGRYIGGQQ